MRLFIAREALDPHESGRCDLQHDLPMSTRIKKSMFSSGSFYTRRVSEAMAREQRRNVDKLHADLRDQVQYGAATHEARGLFHAMMRFGPKLDREQLLLSRFVGIATELFAIDATCAFPGEDRRGRAGRGNPFARQLFLPLRAADRPAFAGTSENADKAARLPGASRREIRRRAAPRDRVIALPRPVQPSPVGDVSARRLPPTLRIAKRLQGIRARFTPNASHSEAATGKRLQGSGYREPP